MTIWEQIEPLLKSVEKPSRYINHELNSVHKNLNDIHIRFGLAYPDTYEVGLPNLGLQILYHVLNNADGIYAERVYAPWKDMETLMREKNIPLFTIETHTPVQMLDILGFTLQHELIYTNVINMLNLAGIPIYASGRNNSWPLIIGGGPSASNPEPVADFFDLFAIGEAEELILELTDTFYEWKMSGKGNKKGLLRSLSKIPGIYVPSFYQVSYSSNGTISSITPEPDAPSQVQRRIVKDFSEAPIPSSPIVPYMDAIHDRCSIEIMRGCSRGCRFCQAGIIYRPVRERPQAQVSDAMSTILSNTGYEEVSLSSLSTTDYSAIEDLLKQLNDSYEGQSISISLPSLRVDTFSVKLVKEIAKVKKTGLTFAPEAGTQRLRDVINKNVTEDDILSTVRTAFEAGWQRVKLYFMIGLPTETNDDIDAIIELAKKVVDVGLEVLPPAARNRLKVTINISAFSPKAHTPFQWYGQNSLEQFLDKQDHILRYARGKYLTVKWHNAYSSVIEGALARGDRRLGKVIVSAWEKGSTFDAWTHEFRYANWTSAFDDAGLKIDFYAQRERVREEVLPWSHIDSGISDKFLAIEYNKAIEHEKTPDCRTDTCSDCGACPNLNAKTLLQNKLVVCSE